MHDFLLKLSIMLVPALLAVTFHEVAHGYVADRCGDPTARLLGRLTINPLRHLDPIGTLALLLLGFGWARAVPVNPGNLRRTRQDMILVALAGPGANLMLAIFCALCLRWGVALGAPPAADGGQTLAFSEPISLMAAFGLYINVILTLFNLLPIPPLDGGRVLLNLLPLRLADKLRRIEPFGLLLLVFLVFGTSLWQSFFSPLVFRIVALLAGEHFDVVLRTVQLLFGH
ncbi:MAG: site-2 protease family protein [Deltaproteobacteria bacterium]|nr:MAG: site-2 protease family protein [Deltaproteobacteria bacterium]